MRKLNVILILVFLSNVCFAQLFKTQFYTHNLIWQKGETPLQAFKKTFEQNYFYRFNADIIKKNFINEVIFAEIKDYSSQNIIPFDTFIDKPDYFSIIEAFYFDTVGEIIKSETYRIEGRGIIKSVANRKTSSFFIYYWDLIDFSTSIDRSFSNYSRVNNNFYLGNYLVIDTNYYYGFVSYKPDILYMKSGKGWLDNFYYYGTDLYIYFNQDSFPDRFNISYTDKKDKKFVIKTKINYNDENKIKTVIENKYRLDSSQDTVLISSDTLLLKGDFETSKDFRLYLNGKIIFKREITDVYYIERNFETGEFRYLKLKNGLPVYEKEVNKFWEGYKLRSRVFIYSFRNKNFEW